MVFCPSYATSLFSQFSLVKEEEVIFVLTSMSLSCNRTKTDSIFVHCILYHHNLMIYFCSIGGHRLSITKNKYFIKWFGNERLYIVSFKFRQVFWEFCGSLFSCNFFLWESAENTYTSRSNYHSRRCSPGCFSMLFLSLTHSFQN